MPTPFSTDQEIIAAKSLTNALIHLELSGPVLPPSNNQATALRHLTNIFTAQIFTPPTVAPPSVPRVYLSPVLRVYPPPVPRVEPTTPPRVEPPTTARVDHLLPNLRVDPAPEPMVVPPRAAPATAQQSSNNHPAAKLSEAPRVIMPQAPLPPLLHQYPT